jgi:hypothetical protein
MEPVVLPGERYLREDTLDTHHALYAEVPAELTQILSNLVLGDNEIRTK